jgi:hypothetical protein
MRRKDDGEVARSGTDAPGAPHGQEQEGVVSPRHIPAADAFTGVLGRWQSEFVAQAILEVLQRADRWALLFTRRDIQDSAAKTLTQLAWFAEGFRDLLERGLIAPVCDERYCVTQDFAALAAPTRALTEPGSPDDVVGVSSSPVRRPSR